MMRLDRLGALHPSRLNLARQLTRQTMAEQWAVRRTQWLVDPDGRAQAVYVADTGLRRYGLVCASMGGEAGFAICAGAPEPASISRLGAINRQRNLGRACERTFA